MIIHELSFRGLAYEVQHHLTAGAANDDTRLTLPIIEAELRGQYGDVMYKYDQQNERKGQLPDTSRLANNFIELVTDQLDEFVVLDCSYLTVFDRPHISYVGPVEGNGYEGFTPKRYKWELDTAVLLENRPAYCLESTGIWIKRTPDSILLTDVKITGIPSTLFPIDDRADEWFWKKPWNVPIFIKEQVKLQTIRVFQGTHIALRPLTDRKNNATDQ